ncbi:hypothetical protein L0F63_004491, partial [Massospora cicadina]
MTAIRDTRGGNTSSDRTENPEPSRQCSRIVSRQTQFEQISFGALTGSQRISTNHYEEQAADLEGNPTMCGYKGSQMKLSKVTAAAGLAQSECGTCLEITGGSDTVYSVAVDSGGTGLDLNKSQFKQLFNDVTGRYQASWKPVSQSNCAGFLKNGVDAPD